MKNLYISLKVKNDLKMLPFVVNSAKEAANMAGLNDHGLMEIQLATEECLTNIIKYAFDHDQEELIEIIFENSEIGFKITMKDMGKPFDPSLFPVYDENKLIETMDTQGLGNHLIGSIMDECHFNLLGRLGKETVMVKYHDQDKVSESPEPDQSVEELHIDKETFRYEVREMKQIEAIAVSDLAYKSYHYSYPYDNLYYPDRVRALNKSGELISFIASTDDGKIIGHSALEVSGLLDGICEIGVAFTDNVYRGLGVFNKIWDVLFGEAEARGFTGVFAICVTSHPYSQKGAAKYQMKDTALLLSTTPYLSFEDIDVKKAQRESFVLAYRYMENIEKLAIFPPTKHKEIIDDILKQFDVKVEYPVAKMQDISHECVVKTTYKKIFESADIKVESIGKDAVHRVENKLRALCIHRVETIYLYLNLNDPATAIHLDEFEEMGFFFSGVCPQKGNQVYLIMQYLNNQEYSFDALIMNSEMSYKLRDYVKKEYLRVNPELEETIE
jgi:anti-sigma regulatory factor (Ser/Thr protein kinase)